jgi:hypothetical protein
MGLPKKDYIGDGVYVEMDEGMLKVTTEDGHGEEMNTIYFEPEVYHALIRFGDRVAQEDKRFKREEGR